MSGQAVRLSTEADARPFYGRRVWLTIDGERVRRTIEADTIPAGDGRTMGEFHDRILVRARTATHRIGLRSSDVRVEV